MTPSIWPSLLAFLVVVAAIPVALLGLQRLRFGAPRRTGDLRIEQSLALGPRERLVVVRAGGERLLLGVTAQSVRMLERLGPATVDDAGPISADVTGDDPAGSTAATPDPGARRASFAQLLGRLTADRR